MPIISVVVPVLNEYSIISVLVSEIKLGCEKITDNYEIIIVDDGSTDETWSSIKKESLIEDRIKGLRFSRNFGQHYAITAGLEFSKGDFVVVMDGDMQDNPAVIPNLFKKAQEGYEVVFVSRQNRPESLVYRLLQKLYYVILRILSGIDFDSSEANFSILSRKVVEAYKTFPENARFYGSTVKWLGFKRTSIKANHGSRFAGLPSYTFRKRVNLAMDVVLAFSNRPLKAAITFGVILASISAISMVLLFYKSLKYGFAVTGWASLIGTIIFSTGSLMTILGILGVYLGRVFNEVKSRPLYIVDEITNITR